MNVGFFHTDDSYASICIATGAMDNDSFKVALACGGLLLLRPYYKGNPSPQSVANTILYMETKVRQQKPGAITYYQVGNEPNLPIEQWQGGLEAYAQFFMQVRALLPTDIKLVWAGMSPGIPGFMAWYQRALTVTPRPDAVCAHVYSQDLAGLQALTSGIVAAVQPLPIIIGECNFGPGAGVNIDRNAWADNVWVPFLDWVRPQASILFTLYFAYTWHADSPIGTPVDAKDTRIATNTVRKALETMPNIIPNVPFVLDPTLAHGGIRTVTMGAFIHATRSGIVGRSLQDEYIGTRNYFRTPTGDSAHFVVGPAEVARMVDDDFASYHAEENNRTHLGMEIAQPTPDRPYTDFQYVAAADIVCQWADKYKFPKVRVMSQTVRGIIGHEDSEQGKRWGKTDPGLQWDWLRFIKLVNGGNVPAYDPAPDRDAVYAVMTQQQQQLTTLTPHIDKLRANGYLHLAAALANATESLRDEMEGAKEAISLSKGEK